MISEHKKVKWETVEKNIVAFNQGLDNKNFFAVKRFSSFSHWYFHPSLDMFGPSKFIGFPWCMTHEEYKGWGNGGDTQKNILPLFDEVDDYDFYLEKLLDFAAKYDLKVSNKTVERNYGSIYTPKKEIVDTFIKKLNIASEDIKNIEDEFEEFLGKEGMAKTHLVNTYERNPSLRKQAIAYHGTKCKVCSFDYEATYGELGEGFIEVHHLKPLSSVKGTHTVNPITDLVVLCANCHRMLHRHHSRVLTLEDLKRIIETRVK